MPHNILIINALKTNKVVWHAACNSLEPQLKNRPIRSQTKPKNQTRKRTAMKMNTNNKTWIAAIASGAAIVSAGLLIAIAPRATGAAEEQHPTSPDPVGNAKPAVGSGSIDIAFITHLDAGLAEQDVYIEREPGSGEVYRITGGDHNMKAPLYKSATKIPHDPFNKENVGPYARGEALGMTAGEWLKQQGKGTYTYSDGVGSLDLEFTGLVPNGVYTMWHAFMPATPPVPFTGTLDLPLGAPDGTESVFKADADGNAKFVHTFQPGLEMSDVWTTAILAINYHSDGKTYGGHPGKFGLNSHIPLFAMLPKRESLK